MIFRFPLRRLGFVLVALLFCTSYAYAQRRPGHYSASPSASAEDPPLPVPPAVVSRGENGRIVIRATRLSEPLHVDGRLDESVYSTVPPITDFIQTVPAEGRPFTEKTEAWVMFDDDYIYVTGKMYEDAEPCVRREGQPSRAVLGTNITMDTKTRISRRFAHRALRECWQRSQRP